MAESAVRPALGIGRNRMLKIIGIVLASVAALVLAAVIGLNLYVRVAFGSFYNQAEREFAIPGEIGRAHV